MRNIQILVDTERGAKSLNPSVVVQDNNDYTVEFVFAEGSGFTTTGLKTAVFVTTRGKQTREFEGTTCVMPMMGSDDGAVVGIGVVQGEIHTTTKAILPIISSVLTGAGSDVDGVSVDDPILAELSADDRFKVTLTEDGSTASATIQQILDLVDVDVDVMTGATSEADGEAGLVPKPLMADRNKFLRGDGTFADVASPITFDPVPTQNSQNAVYSGGVYTALTAKLDITQGVANAGKVAMVNSSGNVAFVSPAQTSVQTLTTYNWEVV